MLARPPRRSEHLVAVLLDAVDAVASALGRAEVVRDDLRLSVDSSRNGAFPRL